jgi:hypothetical protein
LFPVLIAVATVKASSRERRGYGRSIAGALFLAFLGASGTRGVLEVDGGGIDYLFRLDDCGVLVWLDR